MTRKGSGTAGLAFALVATACGSADTGLGHAVTLDAARTYITATHTFTTTASTVASTYSSCPGSKLAATCLGPFLASLLALTRTYEKALAPISLIGAAGADLPSLKEALTTLDKDLVALGPHPELTSSFKQGLVQGRINHDTDVIYAALNKVDADLRG